jgi:hypothetical protein
MYALNMLYRSHHDERAVGAMLRASTFLRQNYIGPGVRSDLLVVWAKPLPMRSDAELGATGLALVALAAVDEVAPNTVPMEQLQALGRFTLLLQKQNGSFVSKYRISVGAVTGWDSLYYPGEAALGLLSLYELDHSSVWLTAAVKAPTYLATSREGLQRVPNDHWALIAIARLFRDCVDSTCTGSRDKLVRYAIQVCRSMLRDQMGESADAAIEGAFDLEGLTTPAATRLEGLLAALEFLPVGEVRSEVEAAVARGIGFLLRAQIDSGPYAGGMPGAVRSESPGASVIRIDYLQHALCAWLRYEKLMSAHALIRRG